MPTINTPVPGVSADIQEMPSHYLVPTADERAAGDVSVGTARRRGAGAGQTWYFPADAADASDRRTAVTNSSRISLDSGYEPPFTAKMIPVSYADHVSVTGHGPERTESYVSYCDIVLQQRCKETVHVTPGLSPQSYRSSIVVYKDCSKRRYKNTVNYSTRMKPRRWEETRYLMGSRMERTFVSLLDYERNKQQRVYTSSVVMAPKTWSHNHVHNFAFRERADSLDSAECEYATGEEGEFTSEDEGIYNGDVHVCLHSPAASSEIQRLRLTGGDIDMTMMSSGLPPTSSGADDTDSDTLSYRAKLVINANRPPSYCGDEIVSNGYVSDDVDL